MRATVCPHIGHECAFAPRATSGSSAWLACSGAMLISAEVEPLTRRGRPGASRRPTPPTPSAAGRTRHLLPGGQHRPQRSNKHLPSASTDPACCRCNRSGRAPLGSNRFVDSRQRTEIQELKHALAQATPPQRFAAPETPSVGHAPTHSKGYWFESSRGAISSLVMTVSPSIAGQRTCPAPKVPAARRQVGAPTRTGAG
jgi:hypothetical protein